VPNLKIYRAKRDFRKTREPRGDARMAGGHRYVMQKHAARRLHYDLRLELDGVMLSWAVTRGPSLVPGEKRLAIRVEDHPVAYGDFEGTIPENEYGGGTVMIWDRGTWTPLHDPHEGLRNGHLDFRLNGEKLAGGWHLVRMKRKPGERQESWLLIKSADDFARRAGTPDILEEKPRSVASGRGMEQIAGEANISAEQNTRSRTLPPDKKMRPADAGDPPAGLIPSGMAGARKARLPDFVPPCLATLASNAPTGAEWLHEIKFDGYRMQARLTRRSAHLLTRNGLDWTDRFAPVAAALRSLTDAEALLDGEIVVEDEHGISSFSALQQALKTGSDRFLYYVFDILHFDGYDLTGAALRTRKTFLRALMADLPAEAPLRYSEHFETDGPLVLARACDMGLEGIVSKRADAPYHSGRVADWLKTKCTASQELVIAGYEPSEKEARRIRSLILGYYENGTLRYAGRVGTGFSTAGEDDLLRRMAKLGTDRAPFAVMPAVERRKKVRWLKPTLVAEIEFRGWTHGGLLRQASFKGLREDKDARDVIRETQESKREAAVALATEPKRTKAARSAHVRDSVASDAPLTHPDRIYWPDVGITKEMLASYYAQAWNAMAPHIVGRPLAMLRCPEGIGPNKCFFQRHASTAFAMEKVRPVPIPGEEAMVAIDDLSGLIALVQAGVLEFHVWGTTADRIDTCDRLVFDFDPGAGIAFDAIKDAAVELRDRLGARGLRSFPKATGGKGLHVVVPIQPADWKAAKDVAHAISLEMARDTPGRYVANMAKRHRTGRIFIDYLRNARGATAIAPYSTRARPGAPVAVPLAWDELAGLAAPNFYNTRNVLRRLASLPRDPWAEMAEIRQHLPDIASRR
jgi:bifunctional non-homologous end joining protein LigD